MRSFSVIGQFRKLMRRDSGGVAIEAAVGVPLLIILTAALIQIGVIVFVFVSMQNAVRFSARDISVGELSTDGSAYPATACATAVALSGRSAPKYACEAVSGLPGTYTVSATDNAYAPGEVSLQLSVPISTLLFFNVGFLSSAGNLVVESTYFAEPQG